MLVEAWSFLKLGLPSQKEISINRRKIRQKSYTRAHTKVETEYFIWMDDDLKVTEKTDLEKLLKIIQDLNYDLIGAQFENAWFLTALDSCQMNHDMYPMSHRL